MKVNGPNGQLVPANREILIEDLFMHTAGFGYGAGLDGQGVRRRREVSMKRRGDRA